jgi:hypothetical protein
MRILKILLAVLIVQLTVSCGSKSQPQPSLTGNWKITSAVGNDSRQWTGSFTLNQVENEDYTGQFSWESVDGKSAGTDNVSGLYNKDINVLTLKSTVITGNIENVYYTITVTNGGTKNERHLDWLERWNA